MSGTNLGEGSGISFNGPIELSGAALSKKYILQTMDNYMSFMSDMLNLFKEDISVYATATDSSAKYEKEQISQQAWSDLAGGICSGVSGVISLGTSIGIGISNRSNNASADLAKNESTNFDKTLNGLNSVENDELNTPPRNLNGAAVGNEGAAPDNVEEDIKKLENGDNDTFKEFGEKGDPLTKPGFNKASEAIKELVRQKRAAPDEPARRVVQKRIDNIKERFKEKIKTAQNERQSYDSRTSANSQTGMMVSQTAQSLTQGVSSIIKWDTASRGDGQANAKAQSTYAQSNQQLNQQILNTTESTAQKASQHADDLVQLERQIQANNITRG
ncbi:MAG: hypothetical protein P0S95_02160 [Rhabdochlamydiaceae bacterium]|nr:hypothetical protein [Candidatus Amphrikana amoebophyrae]